MYNYYTFMFINNFGYETNIISNRRVNMNHIVNKAKLNDQLFFIIVHCHVNNPKKTHQISNFHQ